MKKGFIFLIIIFLFLFCVSCQKNKTTNELGLMVEDEYFSDEEFKPILRFSVCSDVHTGNVRGPLSQIVKRMLEYSYEISENSNYKKLDAALFAGDIADNGSKILFELFKNELYDALKEETKPLIVMGNHDFRTYFDSSEEVFENVFETSADQHAIINGFHFICLSPSNETSFGTDKVEWLKKELEIASQDDPEKPIFVMQHMAIANTVIGSSDWGVTELTRVLEKYPQVIDFSGHSHFPMKDPRSIYQGSFTALGCGTMFYYELGLNGYANSGLYPTDEFGSFEKMASNSLSGAEYYLVEVDSSNAVRITGIDLLTKTKICQYGIKNPSDKNSFTYNITKRRENSKEPFFTSKQKIEAEVDSYSAILTFDQAFCEDLIESYRIEVYKGDERIDIEYVLSGYYLNPMPKKLMATIFDLDSQTKYRIDIYAITTYGKISSKPLTVKIKTL